MAKKNRLRSTSIREPPVSHPITRRRCLSWTTTVIMIIVNNFYRFTSSTRYSTTDISSPGDVLCLSSVDPSGALARTCCLHTSIYPTINNYNNNILYYIVYNDACDDHDIVDSRTSGGVVSIGRVFVSIVIFLKVDGLITRSVPCVFLQIHNTSSIILRKSIRYRPTAGR